MKKKSHIFFIIIAILIVLGIAYYLAGSYMNEKFSNNGYKWVTEGTCASNKMQDLTQQECSRYLLKSNYNITVADHGPPGCWLVLGEMLDQTMNEQPQFKGKGFACWSQDKTDGKQCSANIPCACK